MRYYRAQEGHLPVAFCILLALLGTQAQSQTASAAALAKTVDAHYNHLKSLQARYTERFQGMGMDRKETGTLTLRKPGKMRWAYDKPAGKVFVLDGHDAIAYTPGDAQATRIPAKQLDDLRSPLRFLLGHTVLEKELDGLTLTTSGADETLTGVPKGMSQRVKSLAVTTDAAGQIHALRLEEVDGATTTFTFTNIQENAPTKDSDFTFHAPPGVSVVTGTPPI